MRKANPTSLLPAGLPGAGWLALLVLLPGLLPSSASGEGLWDRVRSGAERGGAVLKDGVGKGLELGRALTKQGLEAGKDAVDDTLGHFYRSGTPEEIRARIDAMAYETLDRLFAKDPQAHVLFDSSYGFAVFEVRQLSLTVLAGYGYGVAVSNDGGRRSYMKMASTGLEISKGVGGFAAQWAVLFEDQGAFDAFIGEGFDASAEASGTLGGEVAGLATRYLKGIAFYRLTEGGLKIAASVSGTRFWSDDALNTDPAEVISGPDLGPPPRQAIPTPGMAPSGAPTQQSAGSHPDAHLARDPR